MLQRITEGKTARDVFKIQRHLQEKRQTQPEVDSQLEHVKQPELAHTQAFLNFCLPPEVFVAVPQPAEGLYKNRRAQEEQHQEGEAHVGLFLVESHSSQYIQHNVEQQEKETHASKDEVYWGVLEKAHFACQIKFSHIPLAACLYHSYILQDTAVHSLTSAVSKDNRK